MYKLHMDIDIKEDFSLIAIHCSEESYKVAYLLNQHLALHLHRERLDVDYSNNGLEVTFPLFRYEDKVQYTDYDLITNKCKSQIANTNSSGGLFEEVSSEKTITTYLLPELKKVDYFLKVHSEFEVIPLRKIIANINEIKQIISAYAVETETLKSKNNLIFD